MSQRIPCFWGQYDDFSKQFLTADFSPRKYFRWQSGNASLVLMDCPDLNSLKAFIEIGNHLAANGLSTPEIIEVDSEQGFLLLEDFGDATFTKVLQESPGREHQIYKSAVDVLVHLQERNENALPFLKAYTVDFGLNKVKQFLAYYYPKVMGEEVSTTAQNGFIGVWTKALELALQTKKVFFYVTIMLII